MISEVSMKTGIPAENILGRSRAAQDCCARHLYWKLLHDKKRYTYRFIGELNNRATLTIYEGIKSANGLLETGDKLASELWDKMKGIGR